ncbi:YQGE family putative transporter [Croceifilum oryzae]|uniref:YQGE family putative transporter n=1 Tax=Croceifilum oryzae TaxID=1553429 RepID=A0AAJ1WT77_9BACL|nr:MFS transporter [Croceifilum oryzae]MDQ0417748.1 YQGE family putative transporter [Croceifilum oryzae]
MKQLIHKHLDREAWYLLTISALHAISLALSNTFLNVYLWKLKQNFLLIGWYNLTYHISVAVTFVFAGWLTKKVDRVIAIRLGVAIQALFYLTVLFLGTSAADYVVLLGFFIGVGSGFYWLAFNVLYFEITERENRDYFNGISGFTNSLAGIIAPILSGWIITRINHFTGYRIIFWISLGIFIAAVIVSFFLKARSSRGSYRLKEVLRIAWNRENKWHWINLAMLVQGIREGVFVFITGLLVYLTARSELTLGTFYTVCNLVSLISYYFVGKWMTPERRIKAMFVGAIALGVCFLPYLFLLNTWSMFAFGIGIFLFFPFYYNPILSIVFDVIGEKVENVELRVEYVVSRELALNIGRILSVFGFIIWISYYPDLIHIRWYLLPIAFMQVLTWWLIRKAANGKRVAST